MSKKKITDEQVQAALDVLKDWVREDVDSRCCVTFAGDITADKGFAHVCGNENGVQAAILYGLIRDKGIRKAYLSVIGMLVGQGILRLRDQIDGSTFPRPEQEGGKS